MAGKNKADLKKDVKILKAENKGLREQLKVYEGQDGGEKEVQTKLHKEIEELKMKLTETGVTALETNLRNEIEDLKFKLTAAGVATLEANSREQIRELGVKLRNANSKLKEHGVIVEEEPELEESPAKLNIDVDEAGNVVSATKNVDSPAVPSEELPSAVTGDGAPKPPNQNKFDNENPVFRCTSSECGWQGTDPRADIWCPECPRKVERIS